MKFTSKMKDIIKNIENEINDKKDEMYFCCDLIEDSLNRYIKDLLNEKIEDNLSFKETLRKIKLRMLEMKDLKEKILILAEYKRNFER